jgi:class 3 adenylate cyclase
MLTTTSNPTLLDEKLAALDTARAWPIGLLPALRALLLTAPDEALAHLNPLAFAAEHGLPETAVIEAWLHATRLGILEMHWHLLCLWCGNLTESFRGLANLHGHFVCRSCGIEAQGHLDDSILASFQPHPAMRRIKFHHLEQLNITDLNLYHYLSPDVLPYSDGRTLLEIEAGCTLFARYLAPNEAVTFETEARPGLFYLTEVAFPTLLKLRVNAELPAAPTTIQLQLINSKFHSLTPPMAPRRSPASAVYPPTRADQFAIIPPGPLHLEITNLNPRRAAVRFQLVDDTYPADPPRFRPYLTGKRLLTSQTFRELFRGETVADDENLSVRDITVLFTDLKDSTQLYETAGDPQAYLLVRQHFQLLTRIVAEQQGAIVKTIGDAIMAVFDTPLHGVRAALTMQTRIAQFNQDTSAHLALKIGLHNGPSILVTQNERADYFGQTVNIAARAQAMARQNEVVLTETLYAAPGVADALLNWQVTSAHATLRGVNEIMQLFHVSQAA